jgi:hypothetical protein
MRQRAGRAGPAHERRRKRRKRPVYQHQSRHRQQTPPPPPETTPKPNPPHQEPVDRAAERHLMHDQHETGTIRPPKPRAPQGEPAGKPANNGERTPPQRHSVTRDSTSANRATTGAHQPNRAPTTSANRAFHTAAASAAAPATRASRLIGRRHPLLEPPQEQSPPLHDTTTPMTKTRQSTIEGRPSANPSGPGNSDGEHSTTRIPHPGQQPTIGTHHASHAVLFGAAAQHPTGARRPNFRLKQPANHASPQVHLTPLPAAATPAAARTPGAYQPHTITKPQPPTVTQPERPLLVARPL